MVKEVINFSGYATIVRLQTIVGAKIDYYDVLGDLQNHWKGYRSWLYFELPGMSTSDGEAST